MTTRENDDECRLGFLAAIEVPERGYIGGLLVTNKFGRPLEFQCTTPVKPNRTQEILYGPTLIPFVMGELIGRTLLEKVGVKPHFVLTEAPEVLEVRAHVALPVACLEIEGDKSAVISPAESTVPQNGDEQTAVEPHGLPQPETCESSPSNGECESTASVENSPTSLEEIESASRKNRKPGRKLRFHMAHEHDRNEIECRIAALPKEIDLREPFERVREALEETTRTGTSR